MANRQPNAVCWMVRSLSASFANRSVNSVHFIWHSFRSSFAVFRNKSNADSSKIKNKAQTIHLEWKERNKIDLKLIVEFIEHTAGFRDWQIFEHLANQLVSFEFKQLLFGKHP